MGVSRRARPRLSFLAAAFARAGLPVVQAFGRPGSAPGVHVVGIDNVACGRMAAETLLSRGYRSLGFLGGPEAATSTQDRAEGFRTALHGRAEPDAVELLLPPGQARSV